MIPYSAHWSRRVMLGRCRLPNLSRFDVGSVSLARFPINRLAHLPRPCGFPLLRTRPLQSRRVATREMLSERVDSPHHEGAVPSRAAVESPGRHGHVSGSRDCSPDWLTCHAGLHQSVRRSPASHAPRLLDARRSATRGSANSAAWPNDCGGLLRDFASFGGAHGVQIFPSQS